MTNRGTDYDLGIIRTEYLTDELTLQEFEHQVSKVLAGHRIHEHDWVDITAYGQIGSHLMCAKCGQEKTT